MTKKTAAHDFGKLDPWGRAIGAWVTVWEEGLTNPYHLNVQSTRDGEKYGACQRDRSFRTVEERDKAVAKYLREAARNAIKISERGTLAQRRAKS